MERNQSRWLPSLRDLDEEQRRVINNSLRKGSSLIFGPAGCGKTAITLYRAKTLQDQKKNFKLFIFTNVLLSFIKACASDLNLAPDTISTFYRWVRHQHRKNLGPPPSGENMFSKWVDNLIDYYCKFPEKAPRFDYILIDEAQDFEANVPKLLRLLSPNLLIAGDTSQSLYMDFNELIHFTDWWKPFDFEHEFLHNYRNPKAIARIAALFLDGSSITAREFLERVKGRPTEMKPVWYQVKNGDEQVRKIADLFQQARGAQRIGVLYLNHRQLKEDTLRLNGLGVDFQVAVNESATYQFNNSVPTLSTVHSSKGLEFDWVILPSLNSYVWDEHKDEVKQRRAFFVALTRSKSNLYLISELGKECAYLKEILDRDPDSIQKPAEVAPVGHHFTELGIDDLPF